MLIKEYQILKRMDINFATDGARTAGQIGLTGANYGTPGQVLTSGGPGAGVTWDHGKLVVLVLLVVDIDVKLYSDNNTISPS